MDVSKGLKTSEDSNVLTEQGLSITRLTTEDSLGPGGEKGLGKECPIWLAAATVITTSALSHQRTRASLASTEFPLHLWMTFPMRGKRGSTDICAIGHLFPWTWNSLP